MPPEHPVKAHEEGKKGKKKKENSICLWVGLIHNAIIFFGLTIACDLSRQAVQLRKRSRSCGIPKVAGPV